MQTKIIAIANQKGGVGKTTTCINLAASLVATKRRVLVIDLDAQGNTTMGSGIDKNALEGSVMDVLLGEMDIQSTVVATDPAGYQLLPANSDLTGADIALLPLEDREQRLRIALENYQDSFDFIIIDCPPAVSLLTLNGLVAADSILIPMQCEYYALEGLTGLLETIEHLKNTANPKLKIEGILRTMYDGRNRLAVDVSEQLHAHFGDKVYRTVIPRNIRLAEAPSYGLPAFHYDKKSLGAAAYLTLAGEIIRRFEHEQLMNKQAQAESIA